MEAGLTLSNEMMLVLAVLAITVALFVFGVVRVDVVALSVMVLLGLLPGLSPLWPKKTTVEPHSRRVAILNSPSGL